MPRFVTTRTCIVALFIGLLAAFGPRTASAQETQAPPAGPLPEISYDPAELPEPVRKIRERILGAARSGDIERLRPILERNKVRLAVSLGGDEKPIAFWKQLSADGTGREILADMVRVFESGYVNLAAGSDKELFVWPYHYVYPLESLTPAQEVELYLLIPAEYRAAMEAIGGYTGFRAGISPDGTWHFFIAGE